MAIDMKYGHVTLEHGDVGDDEPVVVFRARDALLPALMSSYAALCVAAGSPQRHLDHIALSREVVRDWQEDHATRVPRSDSSAAWQP